MKYLGLLSLAAAVCLLGGCDPGKVNSSVRAEGQGGGATTPVTSWKQEQLAKAMRGISYDSGRAVPNADALKIAKRGTPQEVSAQLAKAEQALEGNNPYESIAEYTKAVIMAPENPDALYGLALALRTKGKSVEQEAALRTALDHRPGFEDALIVLGYTLQSLDKFAESMQAFERALKANPSNSEASSRIAILAYYVNDYAKAWTYVHRTEAMGAEVPPQFRVLLAERMREPRKRA